MTETRQDEEAEQVRAFLRKHPEFLWTEEALLTEITLPHLGLGSASSLLERQVQALRQEKALLQQRIAALLGAAQQNAVLARHLGDLAMALLRARDCIEVVALTRRHLREVFQVEQQAWLVARSDFPVQESAELEPELRRPLLAMAVAGARTGLELHPDLRRQLFEAPGAGLRSFAIIPLEGSCLSGGIVLGSQHPDRYGADTGSDLLEQIGRLVSAALDRCTLPPLGGKGEEPSCA
ncbi:MAG: DUF484 family protein [Acidithiobacillus sp.]|uniref:DUF484 family protein n=1 Tax=Acidithiobacillus sp. TaxID=1872118 RepID=UPI0025BDBBBD|nr:DUF484 family protein [Acidithiobacillus sp.]